MHPLQSYHGQHVAGTIHYNCNTTVHNQLTSPDVMKKSGSTIRMGRGNIYGQC